VFAARTLHAKNARSIPPLKSLLTTQRPMPFSRYSSIPSMRYAESVASHSKEHVMTSKKHPESHPVPTPSPAGSTDSRLDEALEESFPASDPIAIDPDEPRQHTGTPASSKEKKKH
jgi:hypothetical protein